MEGPEEGVVGEEEEEGRAEELVGVLAVGVLPGE